MIAISFFGFVGCGQTEPALTTPGVVQYSSPEPVAELPPGGPPHISDLKPPVSPTEIPGLDSSYKTLRVRVFPILSVPPSDPYPKTIDINHVSLYNSGGITVTDVSGQAVLGVVRSVRMDLQTKQLLLDGKSLPLRSVVCTPRNSKITTTVKWDQGAVKVEYRGVFEITSTLHQITNRYSGVVEYSADHWSVINFVSLEDYLLAVTPSEMPASFAFEALKAQAVAARTYAVFQAYMARTFYQRTWDVDPTTWFQSYRGALVESAKTTPAVVATAGQILTYNNRVIEAFFSSNSGGMLCSVAECFGYADRPYIFGKPDVDGVKAKPGGTWTGTVTPAGIVARLRKLANDGKLIFKDLLPNYQGPQDVAGLEPSRVGPTGRMLQLQVRRSDGVAKELSADSTREMRWQFGLKTMLYSLSSANQQTQGNQSVVGYGLGHGVGMSQWGAQIIANEKGQLYEDILKFYYSGVNLTQL